MAEKIAADVTTKVVESDGGDKGVARKRGREAPEGEEGDSLLLIAPAPPNTTDSTDSKIDAMTDATSVPTSGPGTVMTGLKPAVEEGVTSGSPKDTMQRQVSSSSQPWAEDVKGATPMSAASAAPSSGPQFPTEPPKLSMTKQRPIPPSLMVRTKSGLVGKSKNPSPLSAKTPPLPLPSPTGPAPSPSGTVKSIPTPRSLQSPSSALANARGPSFVGTPSSGVGSSATVSTTAASAGGGGGGAPNSGFADRMGNAFFKVLSVEDGKPVPTEDYTEEELRAASKAIGVELVKKGSTAPDIARSLLFHLKDPLNQVLREKVRSGFISAEDFIQMPEFELQNPEEQKRSAAATEERMKHRNWKELKATVSNRTHLFQCPKCKKNDCSMIHKQTRSGDEPMTAFLTCLHCKTAFRRQA